jgi:hypothetical protein
MDFVTEAHRALELLEEYHTKLTSPQDKQLRAAIERVIGIFKSRLFQALLGKSSHSYYFRDGMLISGWLHFIDFNKPENWITFTQEKKGGKKNSKTVGKKGSKITMEGNLFHHRPVSLMSPHRPGRLSTVPIHLHELGRSYRTANRARMLFFSSSFLYHGPTLVAPPTFAVLIFARSGGGLAPHKEVPRIRRNCKSCDMAV